MYFRGKGEVFLAERDASGNPIKWISVGDAPSFELSLASDKLTVKENISGLDRVAVSIPTGLDGTLSINLRRWTPENLALLLFGQVLDVTTATIANEVFRNPVTAGDIDFLKTPGKASTLVVTDSAATPATLTANTHYTHDGYGMIKWINLAAFTQPFKAAYSTGALKKIPLLVAPGPERALLFQGKNTAAKNTDGSFKRVRLVLHKIQANPVETLPWINEDEVGVLPLTAGVTIDELKPESSTLSQYGDLLYLDAA